VTLTSQTVQLNRKNSTVFAQGDVKTTFSELKQQATAACCLPPTDSRYGATMTAAQHRLRPLYQRTPVAGQEYCGSAVITFDRTAATAGAVIARAPGDGGLRPAPQRRRQHAHQRDRRIN